MGKLVFERHLNSSQDKRVWLKWMELRAHGDVGAVETPTGYAPKYEDLRIIFGKVQGRGAGTSFRRRCGASEKGGPSHTSTDGTPRWIIYNLTQKGRETLKTISHLP